MSISHPCMNDWSLNSPCFKTLSERQCEKLHSAALEILERTGVRLYLDEAVDILKRNGADVTDGNLVRIPPGLVERAFSTVPKRVVLANRDGERVMAVEDHAVFFGPGSDCLNILDHRTGHRRKPLLKDVIEGVILCDALPEIDFVMSMVLPSDVDTSVADRYQMEAMLTYTTKPLIFVTYEFDGCVDAIEMAEAVAGGPEALRRNPMVVCYINVTTGLRHNAEALQKLLFLAGKGLPFIYAPDINAGVTGPVTTPGSTALLLAGTLAGLVISQLKREGTPFIMPGWAGTPMDLRTMVAPYCHPTDRSMMLAMGHYYRLPMLGLAGATESKVVDQQAAAEAALTLLAETLAGGNIIHDLGYLESGLTYSFAQLLICHEIVRWIKSYVKGIQVDDETLALDLIERVGIDGQFIDLDHTYAHFREHWYPDLFERGIYESWVRAGSKTLGERASERVEEILKRHEPRLLSSDIRARLRAIVERAASRATGEQASGTGT